MYQSLEAELHDIFWEAEGPAAELPLLRKFLKRHPGKSLELGCGSGRLLLPLLEEGFELEGLDNAPEMITLCKQAAKSKKLTPTLHCCDLFALPHDIRYQAISIPAFTLQLLPDPIAAVQRISQLLPHGGGLYFSVFYPWAEIENELPENKFYPDHNLSLPNGKTARIETKHTLDRQTQILTRTHHYQIAGGENIERAHCSTQIIRYCEEEDWLHLLEAGGFRATKSYSDFSLHLENEDETAGISTFFAIKE